MATTENRAKKWLRPIGGMIAMARRVLERVTNDAQRPIRNCRAINTPNFGAINFPDRQIQPARMKIQANIEKVKTGLPGKIAEAELRVDLHEACPVSTVFLSPVNDTEREVAASFREKMGEPIS